MMNRGEAKQQLLHKVEISVLKSLRRAEHARFSSLMRPTGLTSDNFKFYLRNLMKLGWVSKSHDGLYTLTPSGKELANNLDETRQTVQKQPKVSVMVIVTRTNVAGESEYLFQQRRRHPYYGFWGAVSGPVQWGDSFEKTAEMELRKQTGLSSTCEVRAFCRVEAHEVEGAILEDKLFAIVLARHYEGSLDTPWGGGQNAWMTLAELTTQAKFFPHETAVVQLIENGQSYASFMEHYPQEDY